MNKLDVEATRTPMTRELIAFAFVEEAYARSGDLVAGLLPLFSPLLARNPGRRFDPAGFARDVEKTYDIPMSPLVASGLVEKLAEAKLLEIDPGEPHTYRVAIPRGGETVFDESGFDTLLNEFSAFATESLERVGLRPPADDLIAEFLRRLTSAHFLSFVDRRDKDYFKGKTISLRKVEDDEQDTIQLEQALDVLSAEFALRKLEQGGSDSELLIRLTSGAVIAEVILTLQTPSSAAALEKIAVVFDGPLILDYLDLSTPELGDYANDLFGLIDKAQCRKVVFVHTVAEMSGTLRGPLEAMQRGEQPFGPLGNRIRLDPKHAAYARAMLDSLEERLAELGFEVMNADDFEVENRMVFCDAATEESLRNNIGALHTNLERRIRDAHSIATVLRLRAPMQHPKSIADAGWILATRNDTVALKSQWFLTTRGVISKDDVPPALTDRRLAGYLWFAVGGNLGVLSRKKLIANCTYVMNPRIDVVSKARQYLTDLDPQKAELFMVLMRDQRAQRCLVHSTMGFAGAINADNAEQLLEEMRISTASEIRAEAQEREAELQRHYGEKIASIATLHAEEKLGREAEVFALKETLDNEKRDATNAIAQRTAEINDLSTRLGNIEAARFADIEDRIQKAAASATQSTLVLKISLIAFYGAVVVGAYWFGPADRVYAAILAGVIGLAGFWVVPQLLFDKIAARLWPNRFSAKCTELGVAEHLCDYDVDSLNRIVSRRQAID